MSINNNSGNGLRNTEKAAILLLAGAILLALIGSSELSAIQIIGIMALFAAAAILMGWE